MANPLQNVMDKCEEACIALINDEKVGTDIASLPIHSTTTWTELGETGISVLCEGGPAEEVGDTILGNWFMAMKLSVWSHAKDVEEGDHKKRVSGLFGIFIRNDSVVGTERVEDAINALLPAIADFTAYKWRTISQSRSVDDQGESIVDTLTGELYCSAE